MSDDKYKSPWGGNGDFKKYNIGNFIKKPSGDFNKFLDPQSFNKNVIYLLLGIGLFVWLASGFYIIQEGEQAAVTRFGKFTRISSAGANYHMPSPIEAITKVRVDHIQKEEIGFRSSSTGKVVSFTKSNINKVLPEESLMLTGDENIADINFFVQWRISDIEEYLYNITSVKETVKSAAESAMREIIGHSTIAEAQTEGRAKVEADTKYLLQKTLDEYKSGVTIENLHLLKVDPPSEVIDSFRDVQTARADKERRINQAEAFRNDVLPKARGEASKIVQEAGGYKNKVVAESRGEAEKFTEIYTQYSQAKDITKKRMYLETMEKILGDKNKVIINKKISKSMVPYLPLNELTKSK